MTTNYQAGHDAEKLAAEYLQRRGFKILELNWKTRWCEIDIVAEKDKTIHFVEVKSRKSAAYVSGLEYITPKKLKQMKFAAEVWVQSNNWSGDCQLSALGLTGSSYELIENL